MTDWFRSWHGAPTDPKWLLIARKADTTPVIVSAVVWALFDHASQQDDRGSVETFDAETYAFWGGIDEAVVVAIIGALTAKGLISDGRLSAWERRQPKREDNSTERVRAHRERQSERDTSDVTQRNAVKRDETLDKSREDKSREDTDTELAAAAEAREIELSPDERRVIDYIQQVRGAGSVPTPDIALHLREVLSLRTESVSGDVLCMDALRFRDYWNAKRANQSAATWRGWRQAVTNWFSRTNESSGTARASPRQDNVSQSMDNIRRVGEMVRRAEAERAI